MPHPSDGAIEATWQAMLRERPRLWDGSKFRLAGLRVNGTASGPTVTLMVGLTTYREYVATHTGARPAAQLAALRRDGGETHGDEFAHVSRALGVEAVLETSDGGVVLLRRSDQVATFAGAYNGPSGHPEPSDALGALVAVPEGATATAPAAKAAVSLAVRAEIFNSMLREVCDETGVPLNTLSPPRLIGAMTDGAGKPDLLFLTRTSLTAAQVAAGRGNGREAWESSALAAVASTPPSDVVERVTGAQDQAQQGVDGGGRRGARVDDPVGLSPGGGGSESAGERGGGRVTSHSSPPATSTAAMAALGGFDAPLTLDYWARSKATMSPVTRAAVDCLYMLAALPPGGGGAASSGLLHPPVPPHVWENALDAAVEHRLDGVARAIEQRSLSQLGCF